MIDRDLHQLRLLLRKALSTRRYRVRDVERELGIGSGNLAHLLDGTLDLRVRHVLAIARFLRVEPAGFLALGCPEVTRLAEQQVADLVGARPRDAEPAAAPAVAALREQVRTLVLEELAGIGNRKP